MKVSNDEVGFLKDDKLRATELVFDGKIIQVYKNQLEIEAGLVVERELIHHQPAAAVLAITNEAKVILVKQYRPAVAQAIFEIPAGLLDRMDQNFEEALVGAKRELEEETGYRANKWQALQTFYLSPGYLNEEITLFIATDLYLAPNPLAQDEDERIEIFYFSKDEIKNLLMKGKIVDLKTLFALQYWVNRED
ncbi:NUDIX hydrolase [Fundicoccus culcitae]|uniref:NUDIX hydrolase n=1 Tax=Fundicoccus culcitae TaxID=2969821 RepID=A0ABY5P5N1_9LACT|nr:NUDIX hydrolase [Fundicoccus culcitae]UUX34017.1 NUDIX hydrolase [Fundicoccus culcitae]